MTDINTLIKQFVNSKGKSLEEQKAVYELACMTCDLYHENIQLKALLDSKMLWSYPNFQKAITEESRVDG
jgi:hypothetical protein